VALATGADCTLAYEGAIARDDGTVLLFVSTTPSDADLDAADADGVERVRPVRRDDGVGLYEILLGPGSLLSQVAEGGGRLTGLSVDADERSATLSISVSDRSTARDLLADLETAARGVSLLAVTEADAPPATHREFVETVEAALTDRQQTALQLAYLGGFFEWPHAVTGDELADVMDISRPTFHQHLRAAERKLVAQFFGERPN
jgi:DNA-binding CsgD family transcriptional regulator